MEQNAFIFVHNFQPPSKKGCQTLEKLQIQSQATLTKKAQFSAVAITSVCKMLEILRPFSYGSLPLLLVTDGRGRFL